MNKSKTSQREQSQTNEVKKNKGQPPPQPGEQSKIASNSKPGIEKEGNVEPQQG